MGAWRHVRAIGLLPFLMAVVLPAVLILGGAPTDPFWALGPALAGVLALGAGLTLFVQTVSLFARVGRGTLAPWDPTERLVVLGPYRRVRNPMITGVLFVLLGEAALLGSTAILVLAGAFFAVNAIYMPLVEEPGLRRRFGAAYDEYAANVPRWVPRLTPWEPKV